ncbi:MULTISPECIES: type II toxin-antitoxin system VapC family toxin [unclassified Microbacterium]|uniref:type II toxin-antitoxin system VapC family toxin n=1 Tax=unclassified Microbacterium TaxID=2609290 RepID=UPI000EA9FE7F|nr:MULTISPECIES: type II toxin-antitoxin system VapC family toxin [unclassified Microbacterium]MBT2484308.1 type II toxin-antitoxin system VapC family toxin [Microbacterium sp. ISL-108]RKN67227.1 PIN domain-containing protein [Microbacterium sp. CGR2]
MIVVDASVVVDLLTAAAGPTRLHERLAAETLIAPEILPIEVASALRGLNRGGVLSDERLASAASDLSRLRIELYASLPLISRVLDLRHNLSAYDAAYVALAEVSRSPLLTLDRRLAGAAAAHCTAEVPAR